MSVATADAAGLLDIAPFGPRDDARLIAELERLSASHLAGCPEFAAMWPEWTPDGTLAGIPYVHTQVFKHLRLRTAAEGIEHGRDITSSATSGGAPSSIALDAASSALQARSTTAILEDFLGSAPRPLVVLDAPRSLRSRALTARVAAALALRPLSTDLHVVLADADDPASVRWDAVARAIDGTDELLVYGFTWMLWLAWGAAALPAELAERLRGVRVDFVHSGGWKKLEAVSVGRERFDAALLQACAPGSRVLDYYGVAEQVGVIFPLCEAGVRHAPAWADVIVRDPWTLQALEPGRTGMLQLLNVLALGAPYHAVLTEDLGRLHAGACPCGREGRTFTLEGRVPKAEIRGCANV
jgi:Acyl-protein synthetase, LuxE